MLRRLGALEELFWLAELQNEGHFCTVFEVEGVTTPARWRLALDSVQQCLPLWTACIQLDNEGIPCFYSRLAGRIPLRVLDYLPTISWIPLLLEELSSKFDATQAPLLRAVLLWSETRSAMILTAHHSIGDGLSLTVAARDILNALEGRPVAYQQVPLTQDALIANRLKMGSKLEFQPRQSRYLEESALMRKELHVQMFRYTREFTENVVRICNKAKITVGALLAAASCAALRRSRSIGRESSVSVVSPVSRRKLLGIGESSGLYLGWAKARFGPSEQSDIWSDARYASETWIQALSPDAVLASNDRVCRAVYSGQAATILEGDALSRDVYLSNQGKLPFEARCGSLRMVGLWPIGLPGSSTEHRLSTATIDGALCLTHGTSAGEPAFPMILEQVLCEVLDTAV